MQSLTNHFLIAMPELHDENFERSVTLIVQHDEQGAMGLVVNQPLDLQLVDLLKDAQIDSHFLQRKDQLVWCGGPVRMEQGFVLHDKPGLWQHTLEVSDQLYVTTSRDLLEALASGLELENYLVMLGYAGWGAGQLEQEMAQNSWVFAEASSEVIFDTPVSQRWSRAAALAGIDLSRMSNYSGKA
jgi:putative transcriptional regulator